MGFNYIKAALAAEEPRGLDKFVLVVLCSHASTKNQGYCWPSERTIARECGIATGMAHKACLSLAKSNHIKIVSMGRQGKKRNMANRYEILMCSCGEHLEVERCSYCEQRAHTMSNVLTTRAQCSPHEHMCSQGETEPVSKPVSETVKEAVKEKGLVREIGVGAGADGDASGEETASPAALPKSSSNPVQGSHDPDVGGAAKKFLEDE